MQIQERRDLLHEAKMAVFRKKLNLCVSEDKDYKANEACELKLMAIYDEYVCKLREAEATSNTTSYQPTDNEKFDCFSCLSHRITYDMVNGYRGKINIVKSDMKAFVRVRSQRVVRNGKSTYIGVPDRKNDLLLKVIELRNKDLNGKVYECRPEPPM